MSTKATEQKEHAPDRSSMALMVIDVINDFDFPEAPDMEDAVRAMAKEISSLKRLAASLNIPVIYANDNFGRWRSSVDEQIEHCLDHCDLAKEVVELLRPGPEDYFVLKPMLSGFFSTTLDTLLRYLGSKTLILTGLTTDMCVYFTASDAYMRDYQLIVPRDCVCAHSEARHRVALEQLAKILKADTRPWRELSLKEVLEEEGEED